MSLAFRPQRRSGSRSRGSEGTTVSQTAVRIAICEPLSALPASSPEGIDGDSSTSFGWLASREPAASKDGQDRGKGGKTYSHPRSGSRAGSIRPPGLREHEVVA